MADEGLGVVDAPVDAGAGLDIGESADLGGDTGADLGGDAGEASPEASGEVTDPDAQPAAESGPPIIDGKRLSDGARKALEPIKATNPALYKQIIKGLFARDALSRELPGGFEEVKQLRAQLDELGGADGMQTLRREQQAWDRIDQNFSQGKPEFIEELTADNAGKEAFLKHMPGAIQKFATLHPEGYKNYIGRVVSSDFSASGVPLMLERLGDFIGDNARAQQILQQLTGYVDGWRELASKQVEAPKLAAAAQPDAGQAQQYAQRERALNAREWGASIQTGAQKVYDQTFARLTAGQKLSDIQKADISELYRGRIRSAIDQATIEKARAYLDANDRTGYERLMSSWNDKNIPAVLSQLIRRTSLTKPAPAARTAGQPAPAPKPGQVAQGFQWVGKTPANDTIDWGRTNASMVSQGKYVLRGGRRVQCASGL